jgi:hypothetical protein
MLLLSQSNYKVARGIIASPLTQHKNSCHQLERESHTRGT